VGFYLRARHALLPLAPPPSCRLAKHKSASSARSRFHLDEPETSPYATACANCTCRFVSPATSALPHAEVLFALRAQFEIKIAEERL
jgi:hypothetical protein